MGQFYLTNGSGHAHNEDTLHAFADLVVSPDCADTSFMLVMDRTEREYQNPDKLKMLRKYEPVTQHVLSCMSSILDISQDESFDHMLMACVQQKLKQLHNLPARSSSAQVLPLHISASQHLANVIRLGLVAGASQSLYPDPVTPEGLKAALIGPDPLGLGGDQFRQAFMLQMFGQGPAQAQVEVVIPKIHSPCPSCGPSNTPLLATHVAVIVTVHQAPPASVSQMYSPTASRITPLHYTGMRHNDEARCEEMACTLRMAKSRATTPSVEIVGEFPSPLIPFRTLTRRSPSSMYKGTPEPSENDKEEINTIPAPACKADTPAPGRTREWHAAQGTPLHKIVSLEEDAKKNWHRLAMTPIAEHKGASGSGVRWESQPGAKLPSKRRRTPEWKVPRDTFRPLSISTTTKLLVLGYVDNLKNLACLVSSRARTSKTGQIIQINDYLIQATVTEDGRVNYLRTPPKLSAQGYNFREVVDSKAMWRSWNQHPTTPLRIIIFSNKPGDLMVNCSGSCILRVFTPCLTDLREDLILAFRS
jgi:hypothetical protein